MKNGQRFLEIIKNPQLKVSPSEVLTHEVPLAPGSIKLALKNFPSSFFEGKLSIKDFEASLKVEGLRPEAVDPPVLSRLLVALACSLLFAGMTLSAFTASRRLPFGSLWIILGLSASCLSAFFLLGFCVFELVKPSVFSKMDCQKADQLASFETGLNAGFKEQKLTFMIHLREMKMKIFKR